MVRRLLANAAFSPSMVGTIGFYIKRLRHEEFTRRLGLIFTALAVGLQSLALISPPQPAIASGPNNIIYNGVVSVQDLLNKYDSNYDGNGHYDLQSIFSHYGISREDLAKSQPTTIKSTDKNRTLRSIGRQAYGLSGETTVPIAGSSTNVYERYLWSWDSGSYSTYTAYVGTTSDGRWFAVLANCGNIVVETPPAAPQNPIGFADATCEAITGWAYDPNQITKAIQVVIYLGLDDTTDYDTYTIDANLPQPQASVSGNHGFKLSIPPQWKSSTAATLYTAVAVDGVGGGVNTQLASEAIATSGCLSPEPEACPYDASILRTNANCIECPYQAGITASHSNCQPPSTPEPEPEVEPCPYNQNLDRDDEQCAPCPYDAELWVKDERCREPFALIVFNKRARNESQDIDDANGTTAKPGDRIVYTLVARNIGTAEGNAEFEEDLTDVLEYAALVDRGGAQVVTTDDNTILKWGEVQVEAGQSYSKDVVVQIDSSIAAVPANSGNPESHNLSLRNVFHSQAVVINVPRPLAKTPEVLAATLPNTGSGANVGLSALLIIGAAYFYFRNRQLVRELKLVKHAYAAGGI